MPPPAEANALRVGVVGVVGVGGVMVTDGLAPAVMTSGRLDERISGAE